MIKLEELKPGVPLVGLEPSSIATVAAVVPIGEGAVTIYYRTIDGTTKERLLGRADEDNLSIATVERPWSFDGDGAAFQLTCEAKRIDLAFLFDPMMAVHTSNVEPLPHQITAIYESMLPRQPLRFVLADDPGAGKTIMAGLYIRELVMRADARRILIVAPGSLVEQWRDELFEKFGLEFKVFSSELETASSSGNPFEDHDRITVRLDQLSRDEEQTTSGREAGPLQLKLLQAGWDFVVFDEAHKLAAHYFGSKLEKTARFRFAERLGAETRHLLLMTASLYDSIDDAMEHFTSGMTAALANMKRASHPVFPITIYYAFKQSDSDDNATSSSGWESFLDSVVCSGLTVVGTWPMRTDRSARGRAIGSNALASSVVLACRERQPGAATISRRVFIRELNATLPIALDAITRESEGLHSPVAPVDLSQAIIGPGMAIFSKYSAVLEADGTPMTVRTALQLINRFLAEDDFDADTQVCLHWFEQYGWETGKFGEADTLARAKGTSVDGVKQAGVLHAAGGNVRLLKWAEYPSDWDPKDDRRFPIWEILYQLILVFNTDGETGAAAVFTAVQSKAEAARQLAYRLYTLCERKNWAEDARAYNEVVTSWSSIEAAAAKEPALKQGELF